jgi:hypothetical protein
MHVQGHTLFAHASAILGSMTAARPADTGRSLTQPAIFGAFDGAASLLGVVIYLAITHPVLIFPAAVSGAISSAISMGGGEWLSDSVHGLAASAVMAAATFTGALAPALPFAFISGPPAVISAAGICLLIAVIVAAMRAGRPLPRALAETLGILAAVVAVVLACGLILPGGTALWSPPACTCGASILACAAAISSAPGSARPTP